MEMVQVIKGIKLCLYPNAQQREQLWQMFGNDRFVWNQMLAMAKKRYQNNPSSHFVNEYGMNYLLKRLKQEYPFLRVSDSTSFLMVNHNLAQAFKMLFRHQGGYPRFKSRRSTRQAFTGRSVCRVLATRRVRLPKLGSIRTSKTIRLTDGKVKCYTVCREPTGRYYLSLQVAVAAPKHLSKTGKAVGIDVGITDLAISSDGVKYGTFNARWYEKQTVTWQRKYSKRYHRATVAVRQWNHNHKTVKKELSEYQNWQRARQQKARYQAKIANQRKDYLHKLTTTLVKQYDLIVIEDLRVKNLQKNHCLAKAIANASWYQFRTMLAYKCAWYGKRLVVVKPNYTSQICSHCGYHSGPKPLNIRKWTCPNCGAHHDRDINAAVNILRKGLKAVG